MKSKRNRPSRTVATFACRPYLWQLSLRNSISVENDARGLEAGGFVELNEQLSHHVGQILNDLLPWPLHSHGGTVPAGMSVHTANHLEDSGSKGSITAYSQEKPSKEKVITVFSKRHAAVCFLCGTRVMFGNVITAT